MIFLLAQSRRRHGRIKHELEQAEKAGEKHAVKRLEGKGRSGRRE
jgi:hypothetical protein